MRYKTTYGDKQRESERRRKKAEEAGRLRRIHSQTEDQLPVKAPGDSILPQTDSRQSDRGQLSP
jgi:hypothetical protein